MYFALCQRVQIQNDGDRILYEQAKEQNKNKTGAEQISTEHNLKLLGRLLVYDVRTGASCS